MIGPYDILDEGCAVQVKNKRGAVVSHYRAPNGVIVHKIKLTEKFINRQRGWKRLESPIIREPNYSLVQLYQKKS